MQGSLQATDALRSNQLWWLCVKTANRATISSEYEAKQSKMKMETKRGQKRNQLYPEAANMWFARIPNLWESWKVGGRLSAKLCVKRPVGAIECEGCQTLWLAHLSNMEQSFKHFFCECLLGNDPIQLTFLWAPNSIDRDMWYANSAAVID